MPRPNRGFWAILLTAIEMSRLPSSCNGTWPCEHEVLGPEWSSRFAKHRKQTQRRFAVGIRLEKMVNQIMIGAKKHF